MFKKLSLALVCLMPLYSCGINSKEPVSSTEPDSSGLYDYDLHDDENSLTKWQIPDNSSNSTSHAIYKKISADEAFEMMNASDSYIILDVRTSEEYNEKRIDGAVLIPDYEIADCAESELPDKNALIFVYCRSGRRSANAANELIGMGYNNIYDFGGIIDWPYETVSDKFLQTPGM